MGVRLVYLTTLSLAMPIVYVICEKKVSFYLTLVRLGYLKKTCLASLRQHKTGNYQNELTTDAK